MNTRTGVSLLPSLLVLCSLAACTEDDTTSGVEGTSSGISDSALDADGDGVPASQDCDDDDASVLGPVVWYSDGDGDGYGSANADGYASCTRPTGASSNNQDCDDTRFETNPGAAEICGGGDENCNGLIDDDDPDVEGRSAAYADTDLDGYGDAEAPVEVCETGAGAETIAGDCDDTRAEVNPDAEEVCRNGLDDNCDGMADECQWAQSADIDMVAKAWTSIENDFAGATLGRAEDATGDGLVDLLIGIPYSDAYTYNGGAVAVVSGVAAVSGGRLAEGQVEAVLVGTDQNGFAGTAITAADFDGDGISDVVMGAPDADTPTGAAGRVAVFEGPVSGVLRANTATAELVGSRTGDRAGRTLIATHDVTDDGTVDLIIGSGASAANMAPVAAWVVPDPLGVTDLSTVPALVVGLQNRPRVHVVSSADVDGDGIGDLIIGSPDTGDIESPEGVIYVHLGPFTDRTDLAGDAVATWEGSPGAAAGSALIAEIDADGDGLYDIIVGSPGALGGSGQVTLIADPLQGGDLSDETTRWTGTSSANAGYALSTTTDREGAPLLLVGGPTADTSALDSGAVWVVPLSTAGSADLDLVALARFDGSREGLGGEGAGASVLGLGDVDGDSYADFAVGAPHNASGGVAAGATYVVQGQGR
jgi:hypothetical protein